MREYGRRSFEPPRNRVAQACSLIQTNSPRYAAASPARPVPRCGCPQRHTPVAQLCPRSCLAAFGASFLSWLFVAVGPGAGLVRRAVLALLHLRICVVPSSDSFGP